MLFIGFGSLGLLLTISKQLDRLIKEVGHLRIEHRNATGVEPAGMTLARERGKSDAGQMTKADVEMSLRL
ncbi:hypothetical protein D3C72_628060 [compost metagenome]